MIKIDNNKLEKFNLNTKDFYVLADFDNTITAKECKSSMGIITNSSIWKNDFVEEHGMLCKKYKIKAKESKDYNEKNEMWNKTLSGFFELFRKYNLTQELLEDIVVKSNMKFREGFAEFLEFLYGEKIPVVIISAGVKNCIQMFLKNNNALYNNINIVSNLIKFNNKGIISEIPKSIINPANKNMISFSRELQEQIKNRPNILLFGDSPGDIRIIENKDKDKTLSVAFANKKEDIEELQRNFDIVSEDSQIFSTLEKIIKKEDK